MPSAQSGREAAENTKLQIGRGLHGICGLKCAPTLEFASRQKSDFDVFAHL